MENTIQYIEAKYIGPTNTAFETGKIYKAVGFDDSLNLVSIVDESNENYLYEPNAFEFTDDFRKLPKDFPDVYQNKNTLDLEYLKGLK